MKIGQEIEKLRDEKYWHVQTAWRYDSLTSFLEKKKEYNNDDDDDDRIETVETDFAWSLTELKSKTRKN